jgi:hypothetical protein
MTHPVLVTTPKFIAHEAYARDFLARNDCAVIEHAGHGRRLDEGTIAGLIGPAEGYIVGSEKVTERVFAAARNHRAGRRVRPY